MKTGTILIGILKYLVLLTLASYLCFALIKMIRPAQELVCTDVVIQLECDSIMNLIDESYITQLLSQHKIAPKGKTFNTIDRKGIQKILNESPYLDTAYCYPNSAAQLIIKAKANVPVLHIINEQGTEFYLSQQGTAMPPTGRMQELCVATGHISPEYAKTYLTHLANLIQEDSFWRMQTQQIYVDNKHKLWLTTRMGEQKIYLGNNERIEDKLERLRLIFLKGLPKTGWNVYEQLDVSYEGQIIGKRRKLRQ